jgi:hypothetical protein
MARVGSEGTSFAPSDMPGCSYGASNIPNPSWTSPSIVSAYGGASAWQRAAAPPPSATASSAIPDANAAAAATNANGPDPDIDSHWAIRSNGQYTSAIGDSICCVVATQPEVSEPIPKHRIPDGGSYFSTPSQVNRNPDVPPEL